MPNCKIYVLLFLLNGNRTSIFVCGVCVSVCVCVCVCVSHQFCSSGGSLIVTENILCSVQHLLPQMHFLVILKFRPSLSRHYLVQHHASFLDKIYSNLQIFFKLFNSLTAFLY